MPWLLSVPRNATSPEIASSDPSRIGSPALTSTQPNGSASQSTAGAVGPVAVTPVGPVSPPPGSSSSPPQAAATSASAATIASNENSLRFLIYPPFGANRSSDAEPNLPQPASRGRPPFRPHP